MCIISLVNGHLKVIDTGECPCPGNNLTLQCSSANESTVGSIAWSGSAFNCTNAENEITFLHGRNITGTCNNDAIVGWSLSTSNEIFISMLNVLINSALIGESIICYYENGTKNSKRILGSYSIPGIKENNNNIPIGNDYNVMHPLILL